MFKKRKQEKDDSNDEPQTKKHRPLKFSSDLNDFVGEKYTTNEDKTRKIDGEWEDDVIHSKLNYSEREFKKVRLFAKHLKLYIQIINKEGKTEAEFGTKYSGKGKPVRLRQVKPENGKSYWVSVDSHGWEKDYTNDKDKSNSLLDNIVAQKGLDKEKTKFFIRKMNKSVPQTWSTPTKTLNLEQVDDWWAFRRTIKIKSTDFSTQMKKSENTTPQLKTAGFKSDNPSVKSAHGYTMHINPETFRERSFYTKFQSKEDANLIFNFILDRETMPPEAQKVFDGSNSLKSVCKTYKSNKSETKMILENYKEISGKDFEHDIYHFDEKIGSSTVVDYFFIKCKNLTENDKSNDFVTHIQTGFSGVDFKNQEKVLKGLGIW